MRNRILLFVALLSWQPAGSAAPCTEADLINAARVSPQAWVRACRQCGGYVTQGANNRCEGISFAPKSGGGTSPGLNPSALSSSITDAMRQRDAEIREQNLQTMQNLDNENRSRLSQEQQLVEQAKDEKRSAEEQKRKDALARMGGSPSDSGIPRMDFDDYRKRNAENAAVMRDSKDGLKLSKKDQDWCKLHIPLKPTESVQKIEGQDEERMAMYEMKKSEWDRRCTTRKEDSAENK